MQPAFKLCAAVTVAISNFIVVSYIENFIHTGEYVCIDPFKKSKVPIARVFC